MRALSGHFVQNDPTGSFWGLVPNPLTFLVLVAALSQGTAQPAQHLLTIPFGMETSVLAPT
jgi:sulfite exporter TauE/SafE